MDEKALKKKVQLRKRIMDAGFEIDELIATDLVEQKQAVIVSMDELNAKFAAMNGFIDEFVVVSKQRSEFIHAARTNLLDAQQALQDALLLGS